MLDATSHLSVSLQRLCAASIADVARLWGKIKPAGDWSSQWDDLMPQAAALVARAQVAGVALAAKAVPEQLAESGFPEQQLAEVVPGVFAGLVTPSWGDEETMALDEYLSGPIITARSSWGAPDQMLTRGGQVLQSLVHYAITDTAAQGGQVQMVATHGARVVFTEPGGCCQRCAALVGRAYPPTTVFKRHPRCDGVLEPMSEQDSRQVAGIDVSQVTDLTQAQTKAIDDGADLHQVINAHSGVMNRREGGTSVLADHGRRTRYGSGSAQKIRRQGLRPTTKEIYAQAGDDQKAALQLLRKYGYILA